MINVNCNFDLRKNKNKTDHLIFESRFVYENIFVILWLFACFCFWNNKLKINYRSKKIKRRYFVATLDHHKNH